MNHLSSMFKTIILTIAAILLVAGCSETPASQMLDIAMVRDLGAVTKPSKVIGRDGSPSALVAGKLVWTFGDTFWPFTSSDGTNYRTNTIALADPTTPLAAIEPVDATGAPFQGVPFTPQEQHYNDSTKKPDDRIAIWIGSVVGYDTVGLLSYVALYVKPGVLNYQFIGTGFARLPAGSTTAVRDGDYIFRNPEPSFDKAFRFGDDLYLYGGFNDGSRNQAVAVARVPVTQYAERSAYRFWNGSAWVDDVTQATGVMTDIPGGMSVSYNKYLQQYIAVHSGIFSSRIYIRTAPRPEGPWSQPIELMTGQASASTDTPYNYSALEHPELSRDDGRTIIVSYARPLQDFLEGEVRVAEVTFK
jgi:hypothetical protein